MDAVVQEALREDHHTVKAAPLQRVPTRSHWDSSTAENEAAIRSPRAVNSCITCVGCSFGVGAVYCSTYLGSFRRSTPVLERTKDVQSVCRTQFLLSMRCSVQASTRERVAIFPTSML